MPKKKQTVNAYLVRKLGVTRALYVETFVMLWAMYSAANDGNDPARIDDLADAIGKNRATVFRWQSDFREAFPEWSTPRDLLDALGIGRERAVTLRQVGALTWAAAS